MTHESPPLRVYGLEVSYYTGKLEGYLRYKEIPFERLTMTARLWQSVVPRKTGARQMPAVELPDGRWMTDTSPIIEWLEHQHPDPPIIPDDPLQAFFSHLLEDYADEWLWRPAMHYRWSYPDDALLLSRRITREMLADVPLPFWLKRRRVRRRQSGIFVRGDGVDEATRAHVEATYLRTLDHLSAIFDDRPFMLGKSPTLADFGFFASMFRHFGMDPTPASIMMQRAPAVYEWVARLWNARASRTAGPLVDCLPEDWEPILSDIGATYLPYLDANARAWGEQQEHFDVRIQDVQYTDLPTSRYRVWCLEKLRERFESLAEADATEARSLLERTGCWAPLWQTADLDSGYDPEHRAPFGAGLGVFDL